MRTNCVASRQSPRGGQQACECFRSFSVKGREEIDERMDLPVAFARIGPIFIERAPG
jgi:hypothetical protein